MMQSELLERSESMDDYLARLNLEGDRQVLKSNHPKIDFIAEKAIRYLTPGMKTAEFGIGDGHLLQRLHEARMQCTGLDISSYLVQYHSEHFNGRARFLLADIADPSGYDLDAQDAVFCLDVLEHVSEEEYQRAILNIHGVLRPGGLFVGSVPYKENLDNGKVCCPKCRHVFHKIGHKHAFDEQKLKKSLEGMFVIRELGPVRAANKPNQINLCQRISKCVKTVIKRMLRYPDPAKHIVPGDTCYFIAERTE